MIDKLKRLWHRYFIQCAICGKWMLRGTEVIAHYIPDPMTPLCHSQDCLETVTPEG